jgi:PAS domain S-box-containing protein
MFDREMCYMQVSRGWRNTFALDDVELLGKSHYGIFPQVPEIWREAHRRGLKGEVVRSEQDSYTRANGQMHWVRWEVRPWYQADGSVGGIVIFTEDITARKQAEIALTERDAMLQRVGELAKVGATLLDLRTREYYWSSAMFSIHEVDGSKPPPLDKRSEFFSADGWLTLQNAIKQLLEHGAPVDIELPVITAKGKRIWCHVQATPIYENGQVVKILGAYQDITAHKHAELALRSNEERFRTLIANLQVGVALQNTEAEVVWCNQMALQLLGLTEDQFLGLTSYDESWNIINEDGSPVTADDQPAPRVIATGKPVHGLVFGVYRPATRDRVWLQVDGEPEFNTDGTLKQVICTFGDITARKHAEIALRESEERFRQIAENIHEVFWVFDLSLRAVTYVSPAYEKIWGRKVNDVYKEPRDWINAVVVEDRQRVAMALDKLPIEGRYAENYRISRPDGKIRWIRDQGFGVFNADGRLVRVVGTAQDITEARDIESQLRQSQRLESIGTLTGGIAHDFNNILAGILGFTALLDQVIEQPDINRNELRSYLAHIGRAGRRATDLVAQILTFSRAGSPDITVIRMADVVGEAVKLLRAAIPSSIQFEVEMSSTLPPIMGNASQLHQVIMNLGTNAWHAMSDQKGQLRITLDAVVVDDSERRMLSNIAAGEYVRLSVSDSGCGMSAETVDRIFEPFFTTKAAGQGTGLGLSVVHGIVRSHRGAIKVSSEPDVGTTFEIFFPVHAESATSLAHSSNTRSILHGYGQRILFVDDESALVLLGEHTLKRLGYQVTGETSVLKALKRFEQQPDQFDMVVTDQTMPGMTGLEFASRLHAIRPTLPVILVSGYVAALATEQIKAAGVCDILNKPYSNETLAEVIHRQFVNRE